MTREVQQSHRVGNDPVLKRSFKPYLTTNAAAPLFWKILGENECKSVFRSHLAGDWRISCSPESISAHFWGSSGARSQSVQNALFNSPTFTFTRRRLKIKCATNICFMTHTQKKKNQARLYWNRFNCVLRFASVRCQFLLCKKKKKKSTILKQQLK